MFGTLLRARPLEEKAAAVQAFAREVVPHLATGRIGPSSTASFRRLKLPPRSTGSQEPGKLGKVLLDFEA